MNYNAYLEYSDEPYDSTWLRSAPARFSLGQGEIVIHTKVLLASDALQRYCNAILRNCNAIFDFKIMLFYVFDDVVFDDVVFDDVVFDDVVFDDVVFAGS